MFASSSPLVEPLNKDRIEARQIDAISSIVKRVIMQHLAELMGTNSFIYSWSEVR